MNYVVAASLLIIITYGQATINSALWENLPEDCGKTRFDNIAQNKKGRIINGDKAKLGQFPWMARLGIKSEDGSIYFGCGGTLISRVFVISAAHCGLKINIIRLGQTYVTDGAECDIKGDCAPSYQDIKVKSHIAPAEFSPQTHNNDIILFELDKPAELNDYVQPVCLPRVPLTESQLVGENIITAGWGRQNATDPKSSPKNLLYVTVPVQDPKKCESLYTEFNSASQFCISRPDDKGVCRGDSGSGAVRYMEIDGERRAYLIGITSYGTEFCTWHSVFTLVQYFLNNILSEIDKHRNNNI